MDSFNQKVERINTAKEAIKTSLTNKGMTPSNNIEDYAALIDSIEQGSGSGDVKLFKTIEEMNADKTSEENDLAIVYRNEMQKATVDSKFSSAKFPATVVLPKAITDYIELMYRSVDHSVMFDCWGQLDANYFSMSCYTEDNMIRIEYESSDGKTYTRTDGGDEIVDFGTEIYFYYPEYWDDAIGYFIQTGGMYFEGLYNYSNVPVDALFNNFLNITTKQASSKPYIFPDITTYERVNNAQGRQSATQYSECIIEVIESHLDPTERWNIIDKCKVYQTYGGYLRIVSTLDTDKFYVGICTYSSTSTPTDSFVEEYDFSLENPVISSLHLTANRTTTNYSNYIVLNTNNDSITYGLPIDNTYVCHLNQTGYNAVDKAGSTVTYYTSKTVENLGSTKVMEFKYIPASTQLTLKNANELLPEVMAYGKTGIITGDSSIYDNLDDNAVIDNLLDTTDLKVVYGKEVASERAIKSIKETPIDDLEFIATATQWMTSEEMEAKKAEIIAAWNIPGNVRSFQTFAQYKGRIYFQLNGHIDYFFGYTTDNFKTYTKLTGDAIQGSNSGFNATQSYYFRKSPIVNGKILIARYNSYSNPTDHTLFSIDLENNKTTKFTMPSPNNVLRFVLGMTVIGDEILLIASGSSQYTTAKPVLVRYNTLTNTITDKSSVLPQLYDMSIGYSAQKDNIWYSIISGKSSSSVTAIKLLKVNGSSITISDITTTDKYLSGMSGDGYSIDLIGGDYYAWQNTNLPVFKLNFTTPSNSTALTFTAGDIAKGSSSFHLYRVVRKTDTKLYTYENKVAYCIDIANKTISGRTITEIPLPTTAFTNEWVQISENHYQTIMLNSFYKNSDYIDPYKTLDIYLNNTITDFTSESKNLVITIKEDIGKNIRLLNDIVDPTPVGPITQEEYEEINATAEYVLGGVE